MATVETSDRTVPPEASRILDWRFGELVRAGYSEGQALALAAAPDVDIRAAERLLAAGCPPATAERILL